MSVLMRPVYGRAQTWRDVCWEWEAAARAKMPRKKYHSHWALVSFSLVGTQPCVECVFYRSRWLDPTPTDAASAQPSHPLWRN